MYSPGRASAGVCIPRNAWAGASPPAHPRGSGALLSLRETHGTNNGDGLGPFALWQYGRRRWRVANRRAVSAKGRRRRLRLPSRPPGRASGRTRVVAPDQMPEKRAEDHGAEGYKEAEDLINPIHSRVVVGVYRSGTRKTARCMSVTMRSVGKPLHLKAAPMGNRIPVQTHHREASCLREGETDHRAVLESLPS